LNKFSVTDIALDKDVPGIAFEVPQRFHIASVGELIEIDDGNAFLAHEITHEVAADETGSAGEENAFYDRHPLT